MGKKLTVRLILDLIMTMLLIAAFAYQLVGNTAHEIIGTAMFTLFIAHTVMNRKWYKSLFKGKYHINRMLGTVVNLILLIDIIVLAVTAVMISHSVFGFLHLGGSFGIVQIHTQAAHGAIILISIHLGLHWNMIISGFKKMTGVRKSFVRIMILRILALLIAAYGIKASFDMMVGTRLTGPSFFFWNFENQTPQFFISYIAIMGLYIAVTYYILKLIEVLKKSRGERNINR